jgi:hypothetical protein
MYVNSAIAAAQTEKSKYIIKTESAGYGLELKS